MVVSFISRLEMEYVLNLDFDFPGLVLPILSEYDWKYTHENDKFICEDWSIVQIKTASRNAETFFVVSYGDGVDDDVDKVEATMPDEIDLSKNQTQRW